MKKAIAIAQKGNKKVSPNPLVGAIIVKKGKIIGKGFHEEFGKKHAEVNAIEDAKTKVDGADLYVTLEPCNHYGKQPPCTKAIIDAKIKKVFIAIKDPNSKSGNGIKKLKQQGIKVETGICEKEALKQNEFFFTAITKKRPFIIIKSAISKNGKISFGNGKRKKISSKKSFKYVQKLRENVDAVLVGAETIIKDNPKLSVRKKPEFNPIRVVLDSKLRISLKSKIFSEKGKTIIACCESVSENKIKKIENQKNKNIEIIKTKGKTKVNLNELMKKLCKKGINSVLVEGGNRIATAFLKKELLDRVIIIIADKEIQNGLNAFSLKKPITLNLKERKKIGEDLVLILEK